MALVGFRLQLLVFLLLLLLSATTFSSFAVALVNAVDNNDDVERRPRQYHDAYNSDGSNIRVLFFGDSIMHCSGLNRNFSSGFLSYRLPLIRQLLKEQQRQTANGEKTKGAAKAAAAAPFETVGPHVGCNRKLDVILNTEKQFGGGSNSNRYQRHDSFFGRPLSEAIHDLKHTLLTHRPDLVVFSLGTNDITKNGAKAARLLALYEHAVQIFLSVAQDIHRDDEKTGKNILSRGVLFLSLIPLDLYRPGSSRGYRQASKRVNDTNVMLHEKLFSSSPSSSSATAAAAVLMCKPRPLDATSVDLMRSNVRFRDAALDELAVAAGDDANADDVGAATGRKGIMLHPLCPLPKTETAKKWFSSEAKSSHQQQRGRGRLGVVVPPMYLLRVDEGFRPRSMTYDAVHPNTRGERFLASRIFPAVAHMLWGDQQRKEEVSI